MRPHRGRTRLWTLETPPARAEHVQEVERIFLPHTTGAVGKVVATMGRILANREMAGKQARAP